MEWLTYLGDLSSAALLVVAIWIISVKIISPMLRSHEKATERLAKAQEESAEKLKKGLDANTEAVQQSVKQNETIIKNHLSTETVRNEAILREMKAVATAIERMNYRHRRYDDSPEQQNPEQNGR